MRFMRENNRMFKIGIPLAIQIFQEMILRRKRGNAMSGVITTKHLISHAHVIIFHFGLGVYLRCISRALFSHKPITFLDCIR